MALAWKPFKKAKETFWVLCPHSLAEAASNEKFTVCLSVYDVEVIV